MMQQYYWVGWLLSLAGLTWAIVREFRSDRASLQKQVHQLEINQQVDRATTNGHLELIRQQLTTTTTAAKEAAQAVKSLLDHEQH